MIFGDLLIGIPVMLIAIYSIYELYKKWNLNKNKEEIDKLVNDYQLIQKKLARKIGDTSLNAGEEATVREYAALREHQVQSVLIYMLASTCMGMLIKYPDSQISQILAAIVHPHGGINPVDVTISAIYGVVIAAALIAHIKITSKNGLHQLVSLIALFITAMAAMLGVHFQLTSEVVGTSSIFKIITFSFLIHYSGIANKSQYDKGKIHRSVSGGKHDSENVVDMDDHKKRTGKNTTQNRGKKNVK